MKKAVLAVAIILMSVNFYSCTPEAIEENLTEQSTNGEETSDSEPEEDND